MDLGIPNRSPFLLPIPRAKSLRFPKPRSTNYFSLYDHLYIYIYTYIDGKKKKLRGFDVVSMDETKILSAALLRTCVGIAMHGG